MTSKIKTQSRLEILEELYAAIKAAWDNNPQGNHQFVIDVSHAYIIAEVKLMRLASLAVPAPYLSPTKRYPAWLRKILRSGA